MATNMFVNNAVNFLHNIKIHLQRTLTFTFLNKQSFPNKQR